MQDNILYRVLSNKKKREILSVTEFKKITIFLPHGTQSELQKKEEVEKELKEKYGVEEVNLFVLHCFGKIWYFNDSNMYMFCFTKTSDLINDIVLNFNKIITTNSTGILPVQQDNERLQVIDCKEIFEEYLQNER